ncbi:MAG: type I methionyl aminopeptidase [Candidatus Omnitrophica bacterium]|jgi:methionyl aminopeptidase|nr:type I methionyl aminopeptidase [Candidatus Omnitrophota bacterium]
MIPLKSSQDLEMLGKAGKILGEVLRRSGKLVRAGLSTGELDQLIEKMILESGALPAFKDYKGFPASACISVNEEIVHGIPGLRIINDGDIVSLDIGVNYQGYFSDSALTVAVGKVDQETIRLIEVTRLSLNEGIKQARVGNHLTDISHTIQVFAEKEGFSVVRQFVGHGIGRALHEEPEVPNFGPAGCGPLLKHGMVLAIEPMINLGGWEAKITDNGWTVITKDGLPSAHFEHTVAITDKGPVILSK